MHTCWYGDGVCACTVPAPRTAAITSADAMLASFDVLGLFIVSFIVSSSSAAPGVPGHWLSGQYYKLGSFNSILFFYWT